MKALLLGGPNNGEICIISEAHQYEPIFTAYATPVPVNYYSIEPTEPMLEGTFKTHMYVPCTVNVFGKVFKVWFSKDTGDNPHLRNHLLFDYFMSDKAKEYLK